MLFVFDAILSFGGWAGTDQIDQAESKDNLLPSYSY